MRCKIVFSKAGQNEGCIVTAYQSGKCWQDGMGVLPALWFQRGVEAGHGFSQYALGKLLQSQKRIDEASSYYEKATAQGNPYVVYQLSKLYLQGEQAPKDSIKAPE